MASGTLARVMNYCANCGHELGVGRFCTNCGQPVAGRHPSTPAEPTPAVAPPVAPQQAPPTLPPPVVGGLPPAPRFPLYAETPPPPPPYAPRRRRGRHLTWAAVLLALVVIGAGVAAFSLIGSGGHHKAIDTTGPAHPPATTSAPTSAPATSTAPGGTDLLPDIQRIVVPGTAPASTDLSGKPVTFGSGNLVDGDPQTAWRVAGDASGKAITITFDRPVTITSVGLINGYAKDYQGYDGYRLNRKITAVRWTFEDGTTLTQQLGLRPTMQTVPASAGPTSSLRLQILSTGASAARGGRDYTAISELALSGTA